jgi:hypothetical protein
MKNPSMLPGVLMTTGVIVLLAVIAFALNGSGNQSGTSTNSKPTTIGSVAPTMVLACHSLAFYDGFADFDIAKPMPQNLRDHCDNDCTWLEDAAFSRPGPFTSTKSKSENSQWQQQVP